MFIECLSSSCQPRCDALPKADRPTSRHRLTFIAGRRPPQRNTTISRFSRLCRVAGLAKGGQQHPDQQGDDRNDHQQLDECEGAESPWVRGPASRMRLPSAGGMIRRWVARGDGLPRWADHSTGYSIVPANQSCAETSVRAGAAGRTSSCQLSPRIILHQKHHPSRQS